MMADMPWLAGQLREQGFAVVPGPLSPAAYNDLACTLGEVVGRERVALRPGAHAYLAKPGAVPLHTDHPDVAVVGWFCEAQDDQDGASVLFDAWPLLAQMAEQHLAVLRTIHLECPPLLGGPPSERRPLLRRVQGLQRDALFCSPWLRCADGSAAQQEALGDFRRVLSDAIQNGARRIRLAQGGALFIDNRRILHGRDAIGVNSRRVLLRVWLVEHRPLRSADHDEGHIAR
jgi:hypothetical protein